MEPRRRDLDLNQAQLIRALGGLEYRIAMRLTLDALMGIDQKFASEEDQWSRNARKRVWCQVQRAFASPLDRAQRPSLEPLGALWEIRDQCISNGWLDDADLQLRRIAWAGAQTTHLDRFPLGIEELDDRVRYLRRGATLAATPAPQTRPIRSGGTPDPWVDWTHRMTPPR